MIKEAYVSFELAKLLKEKGFEGHCEEYYDGEGLLWYLPFPTHQMVMAWLREVYQYHITVNFSSYLYGNSPFYWFIDKMENTKRERTEIATSTSGGDYTYKSYEEACEAAIKYCLENLI